MGIRRPSLSGAAAKRRFRWYEGTDWNRPGHGDDAPRERRGWELDREILPRRGVRDENLICRSEGVLAPGTAYVIPARVGVWLVGGCLLGSDVRLRFVAAAPLVSWGRCFSEYASGGGDHADAFS